MLQLLISLIATLAVPHMPTCHQYHSVLYLLDIALNFLPCLDHRPQLRSCSSLAPTLGLRSAPGIANLQQGCRHNSGKVPWHSGSPRFCCWPSSAEHTCPHTRSRAGRSHSHFSRSHATCKPLAATPGPVAGRTALPPQPSTGQGPQLSANTGSYGLSSRAQPAAVQVKLTMVIGLETCFQFHRSGKGAARRHHTFADGWIEIAPLASFTDRTAVYPRQSFHVNHQLHWRARVAQRRVAS